MNESEQSEAQYPSSPPWVRQAKLFVGFWMIIVLIITVFVFRNIFRFIFMAVVLGFVLRPFVDFFERRGVPRILTTACIFLIIIAGIIAIPASTAPLLIDRVVDLINAIPELVQQLTDQITGFLRNPIITFRNSKYTVPLNIENVQITTLEQYIGNALSIVGNLGTYLSNFATLIASNILNFISWVLFILFLAFYLTKDGHQIADSLVRFTPESHQDDIRYLMRRTNVIWGAFLRGQIVLMLVVGIVVFVMATLLGLPNPVGLAVTAGLFEIIPYVGPLISATPGLLLAFFQNDASWLGMRVGPFWFTLITAFGYWMIQNLENYWFLPRIMGDRLKLHPAAVFTAALAGWQIGGVFGILVAAPTVATLRELVLYLYCKLSDQTLPPELHDSVAEPTVSEPNPAESAPASELSIPKLPLPQPPRVALADVKE